MVRKSRFKKRRDAYKAGYRSGFEHDIAKSLKGKPVEYEDYVLEYVQVLHRKYTPDFTITTKTGKLIFVECKGRLTASDRTKMICVKENYPDEDIRFCFMAPTNKLYKGSKTSYSEWAEQKGFPWCGPSIPKEWFD